MENKLLYQGNLYSEKISAQRKVERIERNLEKTLTKIAVGTGAFAIIYFGLGTLSGLGDQINKKMAAEYNQVPIEQGYFANIGTAIGTATDKAIVQPAQKAWRSLYKN